MTGFPIDVPALSRGLLDRSEDVRDSDAIARSWPRARLLIVGADGEFPVDTGPAGTHLVCRDAATLGDAPPPGAVLLGSIAGTHYWAAAADAVTAPGRGTPATIRTIGPLLSDDDAALATTAVALLGWHARAAFCSACGRPTQPDVTGHSRRCAAGHLEFPRTDPAIIVLVHDGEGNAVLARQPAWDPGRYSVLAGFTEAGESLEGTVVREVGEEIGVPVRDVAYLGSQPWPFPRSLMIAFAARAPHGAELRPRDGEIETAHWFSVAELRALLADEEGRSGPRHTSGPRPAVTLPGSVSIARRMVEGFVRAQ